MSTPVVTVQLDTSVRHVIDLMKARDVRHVVKLNKSGELVGITSARDLTKVTIGDVLFP